MLFTAPEFKDVRVIPEAEAEGHTLLNSFFLLFLCMMSVRANMLCNMVCSCCSIEAPPTSREAANQKKAVFKKEISCTKTEHYEWVKLL